MSCIADNPDAEKLKLCYYLNYLFLNGAYNSVKVKKKKIKLKITRSKSDRIDSPPSFISLNEGSTLCFHFVIFMGTSTSNSQEHTRSSACPELCLSASLLFTNTLNKVWLGEVGHYPKIVNSGNL